MNEPVEIRPARAEDLPLIYELIHELAVYEKLEDDFAATVEQLGATLFGAEPRAQMILAFRGGEPAGIAIYLFTFSTFAARPLLYLEDLFVRPAHRGLGVGKALLAQLQRVARENDCVRIEFSVLDLNETAIGFYDRLGARRQQAWIKYSLPVDSPAR